MGRSTKCAVDCLKNKTLSIHDLHGEVDLAALSTIRSTPDLSIHDLHGEVDVARKGIFRGLEPFNSRPPWGGRLKGEDGWFDIYAFQFTTSMGRSTRWVPLEWQNNNLSIHDLHGEVDNLVANVSGNHLPFQFTTSMGRSTNLSALHCISFFLSIHDLHGEVDLFPKLHTFALFQLSIHDLHGEVDLESL